MKLGQVQLPDQGDLDLGTIHLDFHSQADFGIHRKIFRRMARSKAVQALAHHIYKLKWVHNEGHQKE